MTNLNEAIRTGSDNSVQINRKERKIYEKDSKLDYDIVYADFTVKF